MKYTGIAAACDDVKVVTIRKSWKHFFGLDEPPQKEPEHDNVMSHLD